MSLGLVGRKVGMTRIFTDDGTAIPVTVLDVSNNRITQIKTPDTDGYSAVQVAYGTRRASRVAKAQAGHYAKAGVEAGSVLNEFTTTAGKAGRTEGRRRPCPWKCSPLAKRSMYRAPRWAKVFPVSSSATTFPRIARRTVTPSRIMCRVPSAWRRIRAACFLVSAWPVNWVTCNRTAPIA